MTAIAWITLRRITERAVVAQFAVLALVLAYVGLGMDAVILSDAAGSEQTGVGVVWLFLTVFTVFWSTIEVPREVGRKEVHVYLAKPVTRLRYLLGKYLGMTGMVLAGGGLLLAGFAGCLLLRGTPPGPAFYFAAARAGLFLALLNAVCLAASVVLAEVPAMVAVLAVASAGVVAFALAVLSWCAYDPLPAFAWAAAYRVVPDLLHYRWEPAGGLLAYLAGLALYTAGWSTLCLLIAWAAFERQDLP